MTKITAILALASLGFFASVAGAEKTYQGCHTEECRQAIQRNKCADGQRQIVEEVVYSTGQSAITYITCDSLPATAPLVKSFQVHATARRFYGSTSSTALTEVLVRCAGKIETLVSNTPNQRTLERFYCLPKGWRLEGARAYFPTAAGVESFTSAQQLLQGCVDRTAAPAENQAWCEMNGQKTDGCGPQAGVTTFVYASAAVQECRSTSFHGKRHIARGKRRAH